MKNISCVAAGNPALPGSPWRNGVGISSAVATTAYLILLQGGLRLISSGQEG